MARNRNYAAEYQQDLRRAQEQGFESVNERKEFMRESSGERELVQASLEWRSLHPNGFNDPRAQVAFYEMVLEPAETGAVTGRMRHDAVAYFIEYEDFTEDEAIAAMREIYGQSP